MVDDLFESANLAALKDAALSPPPVARAKPAFSAWNFATAAPRGVTSGVAEVGGFASDVLGAFGQVAGAYPEVMGPVQLSTDQKQQAEQQRQRLLTSGIDFSSEAGDSFRGAARFYAPDAATAHTSEQLLYNFARIGTKAAAYVPAGGAVVGGALLASDEGSAVADELKHQGVDLATRTKAGAVVGGFTGLGAVLPMAGQTARQTAGLVLAGGPVSYVAQQAATRSILQSADYSQLAEQYDPLDPVGLAVSTLIPAAFGVHGLRVNQRAAAARAAEEFRTGPVPSEETPIASAIREQAGRVPEEQVDAARVLLSRDHVVESNPFRPDDWRAYDVHEQALARAVDQIAAGEPVRVTDTVAAPDLTAARDTLSQIDVLTSEREQLLPVAGDLAEAGAVRSAREELNLMEQQRPDTSDEATRALAKQIQAADGVSYKTALSRASKQLDDAVADFTARTERLNTLIEKNAAAQKATQRIGAIDKRVSDLERLLGPEAKLARFESNLRSSAVALAEAAAPRVPTPKEPAKNAPTSSKPAAPEQKATPAPGAAVKAEPAQGARSGAAATETGLVNQALATRSAKLEADLPDMMVQLEGMQYPAKLSEVMATVKAEADDLLADGDLMQVAAQCALEVGA